MVLISLTEIASEAQSRAVAIKSGAFVSLISVFLRNFELPWSQSSRLGQIQSILM